MFFDSTNQTDSIFEIQNLNRDIWKYVSEKNLLGFAA